LLLLNFPVHCILRGHQEKIRFFLAAVASTAAVVVVGVAAAVGVSAAISRRKVVGLCASRTTNLRGGGGVRAFGAPKLWHGVMSARILPQRYQSSGVSTPWNPQRYSPYSEAVQG